MRLKIILLTLLVSALGSTAWASPPSMQPTGCHDDAYEPDSMFSPQSLSEGALSGLVICSGQDDYWQVEAREGMRLTFRIEFSNAGGDVDMTLHGAGHHQIDISDSLNDFEEIRYTAEADGMLIVRVYGYSGANNRYDISLDIEDYSAAGCTDMIEPNNSAATATAEPTSPAEARICLGDEDWYALDLVSGEGFDFGIDFDPELGGLNLAMYSASNLYSPLQMVTETERSASLTLAPVNLAGTYYIRVFAREETGFNRYRYSLARYTEADAIEGVVSGLVQFEDELRGEEVVIGSDSTEWRPARNVPVEIVRAADKRVIAVTYTNDAGEYRLPYVNRTGGEIFARVSARLEAPGYTLRVVDTEETNRLHSARSASLSGYEANADGVQQVDFDFAVDSDLGGAFNITNNLLEAYRFIARYTTMGDLALRVIWQRGTAHGCTSCYDDSTIYLGGGFDDPDEYDDSVILHEFGHYFTDVLSYDDSPGGNHDGARTDPLVAYGEGIATVFAMMVQETYLYVDVVGSGGMLQDFEGVPFEEAFGTATGLAAGDVSEYLVIGLLWDLYDTNAESHDAIAIGPEGMMALLLEYMPSAPLQNEGITGADLADMVSGAQVLYPELEEEINSLLAYYEFPGGTIDVGHGNTK